MTIKPYLPLVFTLALAQPVQAEIYKWTDADGKPHFSATKPAHPVSVEAHPELEAKPLPAATDRKTPTATAPSVELYITSWCPYCKKAMAFLSKNNIPFNSYDIEKDSDAAQRKQKLAPNYAGVPLAVINGAVIQGFGEERYQQALAAPQR